MVISKQQFNIFVAYISDVDKEISDYKKMEQEINSIFDSTGITIKINTWKDVREDFGNPQKLINHSFVDQCDIFIGVIGKKWGTPTGQSDCGFHEEFRIAETRYKESKGIEPSIWLYALETIGDQKIEEFKSEIVNQHKGLLVPYKKKQLKDILRQRLAQYIADYNTKRYANVQEAEKSTELTKTTSGSEAPTIIHSQNKRIELARIGTDVVSILRSNENLGQIDDYKKIRLFLLSSALIYNANLNQVLGNHEIQLIYLFRSQIKPIDIEEKLILRTLLAKAYDLKAGWFWIKDIARSNKFDNYILFLSQTDGNEDVRIGALNYIDIVWKKSYLKLILKTLMKSSTKVRLRILEIIAEKGDKNCIPQLEHVLQENNQDIAKAAWYAKYAILAKEDISSAINFLLSMGTLHNNYKPILASQSHRIPASQLRAMIDAPEDEIRVIGWSQLIERDMLAEDELVKLSKSKSEILKCKAACKLIDQGKHIGVESVIYDETYKNNPLLKALNQEYINKVVLHIYSKYDSRKLKSLVSWTSLENGLLAYYALYCFHPGFLSEVRNDIDTGFIRIKNEYKGLPLGKDIDDYLAKEFTKTALKILCEKGSEGDVELFRKYLYHEDNEIQMCAIKAISQWGEERDIDPLISVVKKSYGDKKAEAVKALLNLNANLSESQIQTLLDSNDELLVKIGFNVALKQRYKRKWIQKALELLSCDNDGIRICAFAYLVRLSSLKEIRSILEAYTKGSTYYYDVVCWCDRLLYAPRGYKRFHRKVLLDRLT